MPTEPPIEVAEGLLFGRVYWMIGESAKGQAHRSTVDGPHLGWGQVFILDKGGKLVTLFCPYSFEAHQVSRISAEYVSLCRSPHEFRPDWHRQNLLAKWKEACENNWQRAFDIAAVVMRALGVEVPLLTMAEGAAEAKSSGGKEADALGLLKPVKRSGRRGQVLAFFMDGEKGARSIHEATAEFSITRSNLLSQLYLLQKEHGIGYEVRGDVAIISLPEGCGDPFDAVV